MNWRVFTAMAALVGAVAISSCDSGKSEEELCPGENRILDPSGGCCDDNDYSGFCDYKEPAVQEDVYEPREDIQTRVDVYQPKDDIQPEADVHQPGLDTLVEEDSVVTPDIPNIEDTITPDISSLACKICDEFSDPEYTEANWDIEVFDMVPLNGEYLVSNGILTSNGTSFTGKKVFDYDQDFTFEIRYRQTNINSSLTMALYDPNSEDNTMKIEINKYEPKVIKISRPSGIMGILLTDSSEQLDYNDWHTLKIEAKGEYIEASVDGNTPFLSSQKVLSGQKGFFLMADSNPIEIDYVRIEAP